MENSQPTSAQLVSDLTVADLEATIVKIVQKIVRQEIIGIQRESLPSETAQTNHPPLEFLTTFGSWEDDRTAEKIVEDIYANRTLPERKDSL
jgi:hypothetical protein